MIVFLDSRSDPQAPGRQSMDSLRLVWAADRSRSRPIWPTCLSPKAGCSWRSLALESKKVKQANRVAYRSVLAGEPSGARNAWSVAAILPRNAGGGI